MQNTAVVYFRRFYLHNSLFAHDPRVLMVASLLLAGKAEEEFVAPALLTTHVHPSLGDAQLQAAEESLLQVWRSATIYRTHGDNTVCAGAVHRGWTMSCRCTTLTPACAPS